MQTGLHNSRTTTHPMSKVYSCFPGTGKTYASKTLGFDQDSTKYHWIELGGLRRANPLWSDNYVESIFQSTTYITKGPIFVSSHDIVRAGLINRGIPFTLVYPDIRLKEEYLQRYIDRGDSEVFIEVLMSFWAEWLESCFRQSGCNRYILQSDQYVSDIL